jgi:hypothetical protein
MLIELIMFLTLAKAMTICHILFPNQILVYFKTFTFTLYFNQPHPRSVLDFFYKFYLIYPYGYKDFFYFFPSFLQSHFKVLPFSSKVLLK